MGYTLSFIYFMSELVITLLFFILIFVLHAFLFFLLFLVVSLLFFVLLLFLHHPSHLVLVLVLVLRRLLFIGEGHFSLLFVGLRLGCPFQKLVVDVLISPEYFDFLVLDFLNE